MELHLKYGIGQIRFGMSQKDITEILGQPDRIINEEDETIYQFNGIKTRVTFYNNEKGKLGYIRCSDPSLNFKGRQVLSLPIKKGKWEVFGDLDKEWEIEHFASFETHFNEEYWMTLVSEYNETTSFEMGVPFKNNDEYDWAEL